MSDIPQCALDVLPNSLSTALNLITNLVSFLPRETVSLFGSSDFEDMALGIDFNPILRQLTFFSIQNNFAGFESLPSSIVLRFLERDEQMRTSLLKHLRTAPRIVGKALTESLVKAAIEDCNIFVLDAVLTTGLIAPNGIICIVDGVRYTAVERAVMLRHMDAFKRLLGAGANINKTHTFSTNECGALALVFAKDWKQWESFNNTPLPPRKTNRKT